ncbi:MAG: hypothetical protein UT82_C0027G0007 [Parcubacteria group bacterium GW2011_GWB1_40_14]|nr:MAG: hypothetical protein UT82_C0027G0007 [Parcubacteria group bacterium GW2011_GWB1_40_14]
MNNENKKERLVIITADDFGLSSAVNEGILHAFLRGIVTTASAIVTTSGAKQAAKLTQNVRLPVGLHLDLFEGNFDENDEGLFGKDGYVARALKAKEIENKSISLSREALLVPPKPLGEGVAKRDLPKPVVDKIFREFWRQLCTFRELFNKDPEHLSYHWGLHQMPEVFDAYTRFAREEYIPFRYGNQYIAEKPDFHLHPDIWIDKFNGQDNIKEEHFMGIINNLPEGIIEISTHPGFSVRAPQYDYNHEREKEMSVLISPRLRKEIDDKEIKLISFKHLHDHKKQ